MLGRHCSGNGGFAANMTGLYTRLISGLLFPLHERLKGHSTVAVLRELERTQWLGRSQLKALQVERLQTLIRAVYEHVPYYTRRMKEGGLAPRDFNSLEDLERLPLLSKEDIRSNTGDLTADTAEGLVRSNTGGSSGAPLVFFMGRDRVSHDVAAKWRATRWWGVDVGDREVVVWGSPIELSSQDRVREVRDRFLRTRLIPAFEMSENNLDRFLNEIEEFRPRMLFGYPSCLAYIGRHAERRGRRMDQLGIRVAFVTSERLYAEQREAIESVFACPVANGYGGRDAGFIAHACPHGSLHITAEDIILEIVGPDGATVPVGEAGEIVVTHLATQSFPFIRYRTGDIGVLSDEQCPCGRGLPLLSEIQGRTTDFVVARDGTVMHGLALIYVMRGVDGVAQFKIVQESLDHLRVLIVPSPGLRGDVFREIESGLRQRLGNDVRIEIIVTDSIPIEASGKFRYVVSKVSGS
jgi:phenylacetate-CoA ligase